MKFRLGLICTGKGLFGKQGEVVTLMVEDANDIHAAYETAHYYMPGNWHVEYCQSVAEDDVDSKIVDA